MGAACLDAVVALWVDPCDAVDVAALLLDAYSDWKKKRRKKEMKSCGFNRDRGASWGEAELDLRWRFLRTRSSKLDWKKKTQRKETKSCAFNRDRGASWREADLDLSVMKISATQKRMLLRKRKRTMLVELQVWGSFAFYIKGEHIVLTSLTIN